MRRLQHCKRRNEGCALINLCLVDYRLPDDTTEYHSLGLPGSPARSLSRLDQQVPQAFVFLPALDEPIVIHYNVTSLAAHLLNTTLIHVPSQLVLRQRSTLLPGPS